MSEETKEIKEAEKTEEKEGLEEVEIKQTAPRPAPGKGKFDKEEQDEIEPEKGTEEGEPDEGVLEERVYIRRKMKLDELSEVKKNDRDSLPEADDAKVLALQGELSEKLGVEVPMELAYTKFKNDKAQAKVQPEAQDGTREQTDAEAGVKDNVAVRKTRPQASGTTAPRGPSTNPLLEEIKAWGKTQNLW